MLLRGLRLLTRARFPADGSAPVPAGTHNPDIIGAQAQSPANAQPWEYDGIANSNLPRASGTPGVSAPIVRFTAEQEAPHSEILEHSTGIGCLLLSINPTLLKEMSGKFAHDRSRCLTLVPGAGV